MITSAISIVVAVLLLYRTSKYFSYKTSTSFCTKSVRKPRRKTWPLRRDGTGHREAFRVKEMDFPWLRPVTVEARVRPHVSSCEILAAKSDTETGFSPSFTLAVLLHQCCILTFHSSASDVTWFHQFRASLNTTLVSHNSFLQWYDILSIIFRDDFYFWHTNVYLI
jgi:hypothetical protein